MYSLYKVLAKKTIIALFARYGKDSQSVKTFIKFKRAITFNQVASSPSIRSIKSSIAMFVNIFLIFIFVV